MLLADILGPRDLVAIIFIGLVVLVIVNRRGRLSITTHGVTTTIEEVRSAAKEAASQATSVAEKVDDVRRQVQNGNALEDRTLRELIDDIKEQNNRLLQFWEYSRVRNHDILGALVPPNARLEVHLVEIDGTLSTITGELMEIKMLLPRPIEEDGEG